MTTLACTTSGAWAKNPPTSPRHAALYIEGIVAATVDALKVWNAVAAVPMPRARPGAPAIRWPDEE